MRASGNFASYERESQPSNIRRAHQRHRLRQLRSALAPLEGKAHERAIARFLDAPPCLGRPPGRTQAMTVARPRRARPWSC